MIDLTRSLEQPARAIAAAKRGMHVDHPVIDRVWPSYVGQAKAAILAFLEEAAQFQKSASAIETRSAETEGFGPKDESAVPTAIAKPTPWRSHD